MFGSAKHFGVAAGVTAAAGIVLEVTERAAVLTGGEPPKPFADAQHLLFAPVLFLVGAAVVNAAPWLAPDAFMRKGPAPRAFWTLAVGIAARAYATPLASTKHEFWAAVSIAGAFLELAGIAMLLVPATQGEKLTPSGASGTETGPKTTG